MGFWPYFLQAQRSDGTTSPVALLFAGAGAGIHTTFFAWLFLHRQTHYYSKSNISTNVLQFSFWIYRCYSQITSPRNFAPYITLHVNVCMVRLTPSAVQRVGVAYWNKQTLNLLKMYRQLINYIPIIFSVVQIQTTSSARTLPLISSFFPLKKPKVVENNNRNLGVVRFKK